jgi:secreted protein with Ig-like and vWFA domain
VQPTRVPGTESYAHPGIDRFHRVTSRDEHTSTFSVDVDTASYSNVRRMLRAGQRPPPAAVRIEEMVNYFDYAYEGPGEDAAAPFRTHVEVATCPWNPRHRLARIAIKGREVHRDRRPAANLVFLVDVSGSMQGEDKLPLVRTSLEMLVEELRDDDRVAIVTYASSAQRVLPSTPGSEREAILDAIRGLKAGGSTNGAGGIQMAYAEAAKGFRKDGVNRVLLCTDGDFNVGVSDTGGLVRLIEEKAKSGVFLSVLGYGTGNYKDDKMEAISNRGNGTYAYVDGQQEARRVLVEQMSGTLVTIAKDVKFQVWFNPRTVAAWRLLGYDDRRLAAADFNDDQKDAGDIGAGHEVTALYEIVPTGTTVPGRVDPNPFVEKPKDGVVELHSEDPTPDSKALFIWRLRWKAPSAEKSTVLQRNVFDDHRAFEQVDRDFQWAAAVTAFGMLLRHSPHAEGASWDLVAELAQPAVGADEHGRRAEFVGLVRKARDLYER